VWPDLEEEPSKQPADGDRAEQAEADAHSDDATALAQYRAEDLTACVDWIDSERPDLDFLFDVSDGRLDGGLTRVDPPPRALTFFQCRVVASYA
jgi:hypothetical protein